MLKPKDIDIKRCGFTNLSNKALRELDKAIKDAIERRGRAL